jgi:hypothetical protein
MNRFKRHWPILVGALILALVPVMALAQDVVNGQADVTSNALAVNGIPTDVIMWAGLVSAFMPILIGLINRPWWTPMAKGVCAAIVSVIAGAATAYFAGDLSSAKDVISAMLVVFTGAIMFYNHWFATTGLGAKLEQMTASKRDVPPTVHGVN